MPEAICKACGRQMRYRNTRGFRLADCRCGCGGELERAVWTKTGYVPVSSIPKKEQPKRVLSQCVICLRKRFYPGGLKMAKAAFRETNPPPGEGGTFPAGSLYCWYHHTDQVEAS